jgi:hypothetical protein
MNAQEACHHNRLLNRFKRVRGPRLLREEESFTSPEDLQKVSRDLLRFAPFSLITNLRIYDQKAPVCSIHARKLARMATRIVSGIDKDSVATLAAAMTASTRNPAL